MPSGAPFGSPPVALPNLTLTAVFRTADAEVVLLHDATSGKIESVRRGEELGGWRVESIEAQRVVLVRGEVHHALELRGSRLPSVAPAGASSAPAALPRSPPARAAQPPPPPSGSAGATQ